MARKKELQDGIVSDKCFRLLRLKHEIQSDAKVLKAVVDEVDVLRLCRSLGMCLSNEGTPTSKDNFEFGLFNPSDYDTHFARFIREKLVIGNGNVDDEQLAIGCLFGKQLEVKAELTRMGFWSRECDEGLSPENQGVYCIENGETNHHEFVVFAWLDDSLFEPKTIRDTPAYVLRFLISISSSVTCCLSQEDFRLIKDEVDAMSDRSNARWNSCSVAFRVQKQVEQSDSISCGVVTRALIPDANRVKSVVFVSGASPVIAVESFAPSTTKWVPQNDVVSYSDFAAWLLNKDEDFAVELPDRLRPEYVRDDLLLKFGLFPDGELFKLRKSCDEQFEGAKRRIEHAVYECTKKSYDDAVEEVAMLFAVKSSGNSSRMDTVFKKYQAFLQSLQQNGIPLNENYQEWKMLYLPERVQSQMKVLDDTFQRHRMAFDGILDAVIRDGPIHPDDHYRMWLAGVIHDAVRNAFAWIRPGKPEFSDGFRSVMDTHYQFTLARIWMNAVYQAVFLVQTRTTQQRVQQSKKDRETQFELDVETALDTAFNRLREKLNKSVHGQLGIKIDRLVFSSDTTNVKIEWSKEVEKEPRKVVRMYHLSSSCPVQVSSMGTVEFGPGLQLRKLATVKMNLVIAILVKENETTVRRVQFELQSKRTTQRAEKEIRKFRRDCSLCSIRASDRQVAFLFGVGEGRLGTVAFCRFNETFTSVEVTCQIEMDVSFGLASPLADILLTERSLCVVDGNGDMQSYDVRTRRTSKKVSCGKSESNGNSRWVGGLMSFADELVVGRARLDENNRLSINSISNEDHRVLPTAALVTGSLSEKMTVGGTGDVLYVIDAGNGTIYSSELSVTVRSDAYRIHQSGSGVKGSRQGYLQTDPQTKDDDKHWLRVFFHVFEKFPVRSLIDISLNPKTLFSLELGVAVISSSSEVDRNATDDVATVCTEYFNNLMVDLRRLNKPLSELDLTKVKSRWSEKSDENEALTVIPLRDVLMALVSFVPVQICRAEDNTLKLLQDGEDNANTTESDNAPSPSDESEANGTDASEIARTIRFGLLSPLLEAWNGRCVVVTSMGKQSTGKSYFLNHLAGTSFAISGSRCTDGAWMSLRFISTDVLLVVLDFEGLGSIERSEQEDIFLSVLNASVSLFTVFRMESRFDKDIDGLFSRFQKGVKLIKNDPRLFRGLLYMNVKDVNMNDRQGVVDELVSKLEAIFEANKEQNFLTEMYAGQLEINCSPPFGTVDYYQCMENDAATALSEIVSSSAEPTPGFVTGKAFLDCLRVVLAKISILDWTSMDKSTQNLLIADVKQKLPGILRTGCQVSLPLVADPIIPKHLQEDVLKVGTREKLVISLKELCETCPGFAANWVRLNDVEPLDNIEDEEFDMGFDVTALTDKHRDTVQRTIGMLFQRSLRLRGKDYESSRLTTEDQSDFDTFAAFVLRRRKMKVTRWLRSALGDNLKEIRTQLEQRYADPLVVYISRCQHKCTHCQLGCMHSAMHSLESEHNCSTNHKCRGQCEYAECRSGADVTQASLCSRSAGHEGKCECSKGDHTCGQRCVLARASNCDKTCAERAEHSGEHCCSVQVHVCGAKCSAEMCNASCLLDIQREHSVHKCAEVQCLHPCAMKDCTNTCGEMDHFHGQGMESRTFAEESGMVHGAEDVDDAAMHICTVSHGCTEMCTVDGICEQKVHLKKSSRTYTGVRGSFEYIYQEMNGFKKHCAHVLPKGEQAHNGVGHSCILQTSFDQDTVHYCDARCPSCSYYCNKHFGHMGLHATSHGNMQKTYFMAKGNDIDIEERKYQVGERGIAEMCNLFCTKVGRGHAHYLPCEGNNEEGCVYIADASKDQRRHCVDELFPPPDKDMDELLHAKFWSSIGWEDPCSEEERALFAKCPFQCNAPEHDGDDKDDKVPAYCLLDAWHKPVAKPDGDDGFAYIDGHKFKCVHAVDSGKFHNMFVLDSSGSMSGQPWTDLLNACDEFSINRLKSGGLNDLVSYVTFGTSSHIYYEAEPLDSPWQWRIPYTGGGTCFEEGLRAANEVLSRNNFQEYKAVLIFFSDGHPWDIELGIALAKHIRSTYAKYDLKAFVVGFGHVNLSVLERLAAEMGGEYRKVLDADALRTEFQRIAAVLCSSEASLALLGSNKESASS